MGKLVLAEGASSGDIIVVVVAILATAIGLTIIIGGIVSGSRRPNRAVEPEPAKLSKVHTAADPPQGSKIRSGPANVPARSNSVASDESGNVRPVEPEPTKLSLVRPTTTPPQESESRSSLTDASPRSSSTASNESGNETRILTSKGVSGRQSGKPGLETSSPNSTRREAPKQPPSSGIFISYRRQDEPNFAGRLYDRLVARFGRDDVFMDVDTIELGVDFLQVIEQSLSRCGVMIVVIGKAWVSAVDEDGETRLTNPDDYVRLEIERALQSATRVIPVLVEGATIPKSAQLPPSLSSLSRRNGLSMSHASFGSDADRLIETLYRILKHPEAARSVDE